jgi:ribonuclease P protein component
VPSCARVAPRVAIASASDLPTAVAGESVEPVADTAGPDGERSRPNARPRTSALGDAAAFDRCLSQRALVRDGAFALHVHRHGTAEASPDTPVAWRLGLVIPKRFEGSAVARNTIKRRWRAAFREGRVGWASEFGAADVVVRLHAALARRDEPLAVAPARVRARAAFDPHALLGLMATKLRNPALRSGDAAASARRRASSPSASPPASPSASRPSAP